MTNHKRHFNSKPEKMTDNRQYLINYDSDREVIPTDEELLIASITDILWELAKDKKEVHFNVLLQTVRARFGRQVRHGEFTDALWEVNEQSWEHHRVLLTAIVFGKHRIPGEAVFYQAKLLGAIDRYTLTKKVLTRITKTLKETIYDIAAQKFSMINDGSNSIQE